MGWILVIAALCVALVIAMFGWHRRKDRHRGSPVSPPAGVTITLADREEEWKYFEADSGPVLPARLEALDDELAVRLAGSPEFEELRQLFGAYFYQSWDVEYNDDDEAVRDYLKGHAHRPQDVAEAISAIDTLLAFGLRDVELAEAFEVLGSDHLPCAPTATTAWLRSLREKLHTWRRQHPS